MEAGVLIKQMRARREAWVELEPAKGHRPAKRVKVRRPTESELSAYAASTGPEDAAKRVVAWEGFIEADLLDPGVGSSDTVEFDAGLWAEVISDQLAWVKLITDKLAEMIKAHKMSFEAAEKN